MVDVEVHSASPSVVVSSVLVVTIECPAGRAHRVDGEGAEDLVARGDGAVVHEALLAVDDPAVVDPGLGVLDEHRVALLGDGDGEGRRGDHVGVAGGPRRLAEVCTGSVEPTAEAKAARPSALTAYGPLGG